MSLSVDPRLADRRREVREGWARRRLRWIMALVAIVIGAGIGLALVRSPWLAVRTVSVFGAANADVAPVLETQNVVPGVPTISVRPAVIEAALERDPWVARAEVRVTWPGTVEATVVERVPAGWIETEAGWVLVAADGVALIRGEPTPGEPVVRERVPALAPGEEVPDEELLAALAFLARLPADMAVGAEVSIGAAGIEATVAGHAVLLGNRRDMDAKAATLVAMLGAGLDDGTAINLISPSRPAVSYPQPVVEGTGEDVSSFDDSG